MVYFCNEPGNETRKYLLTTLLTWLGVHLVICQYFEQTLCVSYYTETILCSKHDGPLNKIWQYVLANLPSLLMDNSVMNHWIKTHNMCRIIHWLDKGYLWYWTSDLSTQYVLATFLSWFCDTLVMDQQINAYTLC